MVKNTVLTPIIGLVMTSLSLSSCAQVVHHEQPDLSPEPCRDRDEHRWLTDRENVAASGETPVTGVILLVHGLNNPPHVMDSFGEALSSAGFAALRVSLSGHAQGESLADIGRAACWRRDLANAVREARHRFPTKPLYGIGFSLGGVILLDSVVHTTNVLSRLVLLAPAIRFTLKGRLLSFVSRFAFRRISLPSRGLAGYRAHPRTPLGSYRELFALASSLETDTAIAALRNTQTLVLINPNDELVDGEAIGRWINRAALPWRLEPVHPSPTLPKSFAHLILDPPSLGETEWNRVSRLIADFLGKP